MNGSLNLLAAVVPKVHAPAANTSAIVTLAAAEGIRHVIDQVLASYSESPTGGGLTIVITVNGTAVTLAVAIVGTGPEKIVFDPPLQGDANTAVTITLAAGAGTCVGKVNVLTR